MSSGILFINDIIDDNGEISENVIFQKIRNKHSWIMDFSKLKLAIPSAWKTILKSHCSKRTKVNTSLSLKLNLENGKVMFLENTNSKIVYNIFISRKFTSPYMHTYWNTYLLPNYLEFDSIICWKNVYNTIHKLEDPRFKQFRF